MLVLLTRILLWASVGLLLWYALARIIPRKYLTWFGGVILILLLVVSFLESDDDTVQVIWRIISFPLSPLGAALVLMGSALSSGIGKIRGQPVAIALTILLFSSIPLASQWLVSDAEQAVRTAYLERRELCGEVCDTEIPTRASLANAGAIVVLGNSSDIDRDIDASNLSVSDASVSTSLAPRLAYAAALYQQSRNQGGSPQVIVTADTNQDESRPRQVIQSILSRNGVFSEDIRTESTGLDVRRAAEDIEKLFEDSGRISDNRDNRTQNDPRVVLVAPAILMSRAALTFERMGLQVIAKPTDFYTAPVGSDGDLLRRLPDILPSVDALQLTTRYWNELLTSLYYFLRGWLPNFNFGWDSTIDI